MTKGSRIGLARPIHGYRDEMFLFCLKLVFGLPLESIAQQRPGPSASCGFCYAPSIAAIKIKIVVGIGKIKLSLESHMFASKLKYLTRPEIKNC